MEQIIYRYTPAIYGRLDYECEDVWEFLQAASQDKGVIAALDGLEIDLASDFELIGIRGWQIVFSNYEYLVTFYKTDDDSYLFGGVTINTNR